MYWLDASGYTISSTWNALAGVYKDPVHTLSVLPCPLYGIMWRLSDIGSGVQKQASDLVSKLQNNHKHAAESQ